MIIFDQDETLLVREPHYEVAIDIVARYYNKRFDPRSSLRYRIAGADWKREVIPDVIRTLGLWTSIEDFDRITKAALNALAILAVPMPGSEKLLKHLQRHNVKLAIATSCEKERIEDSWTNAPNLFSCFDIVIPGNHPAVHHGKPYPDLLLAAAREGSCDPYECVYVGDNVVDEEAACRAGMKFVAVPNYLCKASDFKRSAAVIPSLEDFPLESLGLPAWDS